VTRPAAGIHSGTASSPGAVEAHDEKEAIGNGSHQRVIVHVARFDQRVQKKLRGE
jgi:predicted thioesterase